jgi:ribosomal protein S18 acetylase RimI-like enzyme
MADSRTASVTAVLPTRQATVDDLPSVVALVNRAYRVEDFFVRGDRTDEDDLRARLSIGCNFLLIEDPDSGAAVGSVCVEVRGRRGYLSMLSVEPAWQGRGLGRQLVAAAEEHCRAAGCGFLDLDVVDVRTELPGFYRALGFAPFDTAPFPDQGKLLSAAYLVLMTKPLIPAAGSLW